MAPEGGSLHQQLAHLAHQGHSGRAHKILVDYERNYRGAVAVAADSARARASGAARRALRRRRLLPRKSSPRTVMTASARRARVAPWTAVT